MNIYTIGHSTQSIEAFVNMLESVQVEMLVDVRAYPASRKFPQFNQETLTRSLLDNGIEYEHIANLGGRRNKSRNFQEELNNGWNNQSFHNYADYTLTKEFQKGVLELEQIAKKKVTAYCCSERHPARCHRLLISNWLEAHGWKVYHIISQGEMEVITPRHVLGEWGAMPIIEADRTVVYPEL